MTCTPTTLTHLFVYAVIVTFLSITVVALLIAGFRAWRIGAALLRESGGDVATCWAEIAAIRRANLAAEKLQRRAWAVMSRLSTKGEGK